MKEYTYPFNNIQFDESSSLLLDASFLLSLVYEDDPKHGNCISFLRTLVTSKSTLYVTNTVCAEVINQIVYRLFVEDVRYKIGNVKPFNTKENIRLILDFFHKNDRKYIKDKRKDKIYRIPYKKYFNIIYKNPEKRYLLDIYFKTGVKMDSQLQEALNIKYISIDSTCLKYAKELMVKYMLTINDAIHLSTAEKNNIIYLLTLDADFMYAKNMSTILLRIL